MADAPILPDSDLPDGSALPGDIANEVDSQAADTDNPPEGEAATLAASADPEARADLPRGARAAQFRHKQRLQISAAIPALALIGLGIAYLLMPPWLTPALGLGIVVGALGISLFARFWLNARRERGLCFLGLTLLLWDALIALIVARGLQMAQVWPVLIIALGLAALCTFLFERGHDRSLILPGVALLIGGGLALAALTPNVLAFDQLATLINRYWPIVPIVLAILLLPLAFGNRAHR